MSFLKDKISVRIPAVNLALLFIQIFRDEMKIFITSNRSSQTSYVKQSEVESNVRGSPEGQNMGLWDQTGISHPGCSAG